MSPLRSPNADPSHSPLRQLGADLKAGLARVRRRPGPVAQAADPPPLPAPGSDDAVAAYEAARSAFDRLTPLDSAAYAALRIGDTHALWTTDWVKAAQRGDFARFSTRERDAAKALTPAELSDLLVLTARRDLQFAEAQQRTNLRTLYALAYPDGEDPAEEPDPAGDHAHVAIAEHRAAYAAWKPLGDAWNEATTDHDALKAIQDEPHAVMAEAFEILIGTTASTPAGLVALAGYLPEAVREASCVEVEEDARHALRSVCRAVIALFGPEADAELTMLEAEFLAADRAFCAAVDAMHAGQARYVKPPVPRDLKVWSNDWVYSSIPRPKAQHEGFHYREAEVEILRTRPCVAHYVGGGDSGVPGPGGTTRIRPDPQAQARADAIVAAWDEWQAQIREARAGVDLEALEAAYDATTAARDAVLQRVRETTARGFAGLAVKARIAANMAAIDDPKAEGLKHYDPDDSDGLFLDLAGDVLTLTGGLPDAFRLEA